ncbi:hypothetical protein RvY_08400 [Ramazzottius varieornatus]|uniref:Uncharacterized protein n=1 Tax=Ramazzottius varieornatus TaxID=947166 RepID=A0A1D1VBB3_RAMVA|nr:hypothetical protein RvY_08400 [Ramazzottius varieornatus]
MKQYPMAYATPELIALTFDVSTYITRNRPSYRNQIQKQKEQFTAHSIGQHVLKSFTPPWFQFKVPKAQNAHHTTLPGRCIVCSNYPGSNLDLTSKSTNVADCLPGIEDVNPVVRLSKYSVDCYSHLGLSKEEGKVKLLCQAQFDVPQDKIAGNRHDVRHLPI